MAAQSERPTKRPEESSFFSEDEIISVYGHLRRVCFDEAVANLP